MYGVLYAISPELFPAKDRGTGNGLTATATRVFGIMVRPPSLPRYQNPLSSDTLCTARVLCIAGPGHRAVREPSDGRAGVRVGRAHHRERGARAAAPVRAAREGVDLIRRRAFVLVCPCVGEEDTNVR